MTTIERIAMSLNGLAQNTFPTSPILRSRYDDDDYIDEISEDDDDYYSPTSPDRGDNESDEDYDERMSDLYGDDWNVV